MFRLRCRGRRIALLYRIAANLSAIHELLNPTRPGRRGIGFTEDVGESVLPLKRPRISGACGEQIRAQQPRPPNSASLKPSNPAPTIAKSAEEAAAHFAWFAHFATLDCPASSRLTRERLEWRPAQPTLLADLERGSYFRS